MRFGRISKALALAATAALALSACTGGTPEPTKTSTSATAANGGNVTVAETDGFTSFNSNSSTGLSDLNSKIDYATHSGFNYVDNNLKIVRNEQFGKYEKVSENPLTIKYTINPGVLWSDGAPVDANDLLLSWAAMSGYYNDATLDKNYEVKSGTSYFDYAGDSSGLALTSFPVLGDDGRSITLTYSKPFADWEISFGVLVDVPAHIVAIKSGLKDAAALTALLKTVPKGDPAKPVAANPQLRKVSNFWNTGFDTDGMPDPSLALSNGPYVVKNIDAGQSLVLTRNTDYKWGPTPHLDTITVRQISDPSAQVAALRNKEIDIAAPQASADTVEQLKALKSQGVTTQQGQKLGYDQVTMNFKGVMSNPAYREAFLKTIPRQEIVDKLIGPMDPNATPLNSQLFIPTQAAYKETVLTNGSSAYKDVDIAGAKALLNGATPTVRILYNKDSANRVDEFAMIAASAAQAGFKVVDEGKSKTGWTDPLYAGDYDAAVFGWTSSGVGVSTVPQVFKTGAISNTNNFSNPVADQLMDELIVTPDAAKQDALKVQIDKLIWASYYGLPLFQGIGITGIGPNVSGLVYTPSNNGVWWNVWDWQRTK
jgi:peptide/nickel transport system substrate-binding protein